MNPGLQEQLTGAIIRFRRADSCLSLQTSLQLSEFAVLTRVAGGCVCAEKGRCVSEIQEALPLSKPAVSQILNGLERKGYIVRAIDPADRRRVTVTVTTAGESELEECRQCYRGVLDDVLAKLGDDNARILVQQLGRLMDILEAL